MFDHNFDDKSNDKSNHNFDNKFDHKFDHMSDDIKRVISISSFVDDENEQKFVEWVLREYSTKKKPLDIALFSRTGDSIIDYLVKFCTMYMFYIQHLLSFKKFVTSKSSSENNEDFFFWFLDTIRADLGFLVRKSNQISKRGNSFFSSEQIQRFLNMSSTLFKFFLELKITFSTHQEIDNGFRLYFEGDGSKAISLRDLHTPDGFRTFLSKRRESLCKLDQIIHLLISIQIILWRYFRTNHSNYSIDSNGRLRKFDESLFRPVRKI